MRRRSSATWTRVKGGVVTIRLRDDVPTLMMVAGRSYRVGQVGAFLRVPLGYTQLYGVCTLVGAAAAPVHNEAPASPHHRCLSATLFGESIGDVFERGVSQYPTIDDEVHLVTPQERGVPIGAGPSAVPVCPKEGTVARLPLERLRPLPVASGGRRRLQPCASGST